MDNSTVGTVYQISKNSSAMVQWLENAISVVENLSRSEGRSNNLYRAFTSATPLERSWINIRWLISFRADRNVAFLKFSANCPRAIPRPRSLFSLSPSSFFSVVVHPRRARSLVSSYYSRRRSPCPLFTFWKPSCIYGSCYWPHCAR